jgi:hypothetical protein
MSMTDGHVHVRGNAPIHFNVYVHVHLHVHVVVRAVYMLHLILILILILYVHAFPIIHATVPEGFNKIPQNTVGPMAIRSARLYHLVQTQLIQLM